MSVSFPIGITNYLKLCVLQIHSTTFHFFFAMQMCCHIPISNTLERYCSEVDVHLFMRVCIWTGRTPGSSSARWKQASAASHASDANVRVTNPHPAQKTKRLRIMFYNEEVKLQQFISECQKWYVPWIQRSQQKQQPCRVKTEGQFMFSSTDLGDFYFNKCSIYVESSKKNLSHKPEIVHKLNHM